MKLAIMFNSKPMIGVLLPITVLLLIGTPPGWAAPGSDLGDSDQRQRQIALNCEVSSWVPTPTTRIDEAFFVLCSLADNSISIIRLNQDLQIIQNPPTQIINETPISPTTTTTTTTTTPTLRPFKSSYFYEPKYNALYYVVAYSNHRNNSNNYYYSDDYTRTAKTAKQSIIRIYKIQKSTNNNYKIKTTQTMTFVSALVDFDIHFSSKHCYMSVILHRSTDNLELYEWTRTQFDQQSVRTTYAYPQSVKMFKIRDYFYIAVAQQQLYNIKLSRHQNSSYITTKPDRSDLELLDEEYAQALFVGNPIFRFRQNYEHQLIYHQYIKLSGQAKKIEFFSELPEQPWKYTINNNSSSSNYSVNVNANQQQQQQLAQYRAQNFIVFGTSDGVDIYVWSNLNQQFWPHQLYTETTISGVSDLSIGLVPNTTSDTLITILSGSGTKLHFLTARIRPPMSHHDANTAGSTSANGASSYGQDGTMAIRSKKFNITWSLDLNMNGLMRSVRLINLKTRKNDRLYVQTMNDVRGGLHQTMMHQITTINDDAFTPHQRDARQYHINNNNNNNNSSINIMGQLKVQLPNNEPENCFAELERLLLVREYQITQLNARRDKIWRKDGSSDYQDHDHHIVNITTPVIVHGNVVIKGSLLKSPQMTVIREKNPANLAGPSSATTISPAIFDANLNIAHSRLEDILKKLSHAVHPDADQLISGKTRFLRGLLAREVVFSSGISNDDVKLNGIAFKQLEREAVTSTDEQRIRTHTIFRKSVVADTLEIRGRINGGHYLKDAFDITSRDWQIIDSPLDLRSVEVPTVILQLNSTLNGIRLNEFVTLDRPSQKISGVKTFKSLTMRNLKIHRDAFLNGYNVSLLAHNAIPLSNPIGQQLQQQPPKIITGNLSFLQNVRVGDLIINNLINSHINLTSLLSDSVKSFAAYGLSQTITGHKRFLNGLHVGRLDTPGRINDVLVRDIFTLQQQQQQTVNGFNHNITGRFVFTGPVTMKSNLQTYLVNGIDLNLEAVVRSRQLEKRQIITGVKTFRKPMRIVDRIDVSNDNRTTINNFHFHQVLDELDRKMRVPPPMYIDQLIINGNLLVASNFINNMTCPLQSLKDKLVSRSGDNQIITVPIRVKKLTAKSIFVGPRGLNQMSFPSDFVLKTIPPAATTNPNIDPATKQLLMDNVQYVYGRKTIENLRLVNVGGPVIVHPGASINNVSYQQFHAYIAGERRANETGQKFLQTMLVHGNIYANKINGRSWPRDILLKSMQNQRIYSKLIFGPNAQLQVRGHLTLRGPVNLRGRFNDINLTQFVRNSVTYGDKDLLVVHRPIRNKIFVGGIQTVELICGGTIDGVNFDEMRQRVVFIDGEEQHITGRKTFVNMVNFTQPITIKTLNGLNFQEHINRIVLSRNGQDLSLGLGPYPIVVRGHKTILGTIKINKDLLVDGRINGLNLSDIQAKSISLASNVNNTFNRTFIVEGDVYMDEMFIDEKHGVIDGVPLKNLIKIANNGSPSTMTTHIKSPVVLHTDIIVNKDVLLNGLSERCDITQALKNALSWSHAPSLAGHLPSRRQRRHNYNAHSNISIGYPTEDSAENPTEDLTEDSADYSTEDLIADSTEDFAGYPTEDLTADSTEYLPGYPTEDLVANLTEELTGYPSEDLVADSTENLESYPSEDSIADPAEDLEGYPTEDLVANSTEDLIADSTENLAGYLTENLMANSTEDLIADSTENLAAYPTENLIANLTEDLLEDSREGLTKKWIVKAGKSVLLVVSQDRTFRPESCPITTPASMPLAQTLMTSPGNNVVTPPLYYYNQYSASANAAPVSIMPQFSQHLQLKSLPLSLPFPMQPTPPTTTGLLNIYLLQTLVSSNSFNDSSFDMLQSMELPPISQLEHFDYDQRTYLIAVSSKMQVVYLLKLRGYHGFQIIQQFATPYIDSVRVLSNPLRLALISRQRQYSRIMAAVLTS